MNKDTLVANQQLEIENLLEKLEEYRGIFRDIDNALYCIGGPLNDNKLGFNREQKDYLQNRIGNLLESLDWDEIL